MTKTLCVCVCGFYNNLREALLAFRIDDRYVMSFRFWNLLFQLALRMEPRISNISVNQFLGHEMLLLHLFLLHFSLSLAPRILFIIKKIPWNWPEQGDWTEWRNENKPLKILFCVTRFHFCFVLRFSRKWNKRKEKKSSKKGSKRRKISR